MVLPFSLEGSLEITKKNLLFLRPRQRKGVAQGHREGVSEPGKRTQVF